MNFTAALNRVPESLHLMVRLIVVLQDELGAGNEVTLYAREQLPPVDVRLNLVAGPHMSVVICYDFVVGMNSY